jgi:cardiolipin synthase
MPLEITIGHWITLHGLVVLLGLAIYVATSHARQQRRHPSAAIAWVISLALLPYLALPLYLLIGSRKVPRAQSVPALSTRVEHSSTTASRFLDLSSALGLPAPSSYQNLNIHETGLDALHALRAVISHATSSLDLCTFLVAQDVLGEEITTLLMQRAQQGVRVRLLIDGIGVYLGGRPDLKRLRAAGVNVVLFVSPFRSRLPGRTNLRNHRKMVIADGTHLWSGGRNLAAEYFVGDETRKHKRTPWIDLSFDLQGDPARQALERFNQDWRFATQTRETGSPPPGTLPSASHEKAAQLIASGPDQRDDTLYSLLISSFFTARKRIMVVTPYFVPDATLLMALTLAARRGLVVDVVLPTRSNHRLADLARPAALRDMAAAGARVWLVPEMIHAKGFIIDNELALTGSANLDERSMFLNYELMFAFYDPADVQRFALWIERQRATAAPYRLRRPGAVRLFFEGLIRGLAFQL